MSVGTFGAVLSWLVSVTDIGRYGNIACGEVVSALPVEANDMYSCLIEGRAAEVSVVVREGGCCFC